MFHLFNTDEQTVKKVHKSELYGTLVSLKEEGAIFSLDIDNDICYSFEDEFESEEINVLIENATFH
jgi:hypothetical protein